MLALFLARNFDLIRKKIWLVFDITTLSSLRLLHIHVHSVVDDDANDILHRRERWLPVVSNLGSQVSEP